MRWCEAYHALDNSVGTFEILKPHIVPRECLKVSLQLGFRFFFIPMESTHDDMMDAHNAIALKKLLKRTIVLDNFYLSSLEIRSHYLMVDFCPRCNQFLKLRQLRF